MLQRKPYNYYNWMKRPLLIPKKNKTHTWWWLSFFIATVFCFVSGCKSKTKVPAIFEVMSDAKTGLHFANRLMPTPEFNIFKYLYFYNGAGIGAGDFNNDGKMDLFFTANQGQNKLYLNEGDLQFKDVTTEAKIFNDNAWSTGVSVVDINNDGLLDIYICRVGKYETLNSQNQFLICQGIDKNGVPFYKDEAHEFGLDFKGFCTQAAFFDYDGDGDLDMYLLDHSIHQNGTFGIRQKLLATKNSYSGDHIFRNNGNNTFTEVTQQTGIHSSVLGYGLGICVSD
ncbi:MAG TPA: VCBS repeat-containing protein, partial [Hanamia sp.]|nr:VCBS repeat-containing protein [Hanamia sp.]